MVYVSGWYVLKSSERMARDIFLALMPVGPLYLGYACTQFLPGSRWLASAKGVAASLITFAVTQLLVFAASSLAELLTGKRPGVTQCSQ